MRLDDYMRHKELIEKRLQDPARRKLHVQYVGPSHHGGCHVTIFVMGTWFHHIHITEEALETPDLFAYTIESSLRAAVGVLIEEAVRIEAPKLREELDVDKELNKDAEVKES
jgi:hypothetical protein